MRRAFQFAALCLAFSFDRVWRHEPGRVGTRLRKRSIRGGIPMLRMVFGSGWRWGDPPCLASLPQSN